MIYNAIVDMFDINDPYMSSIPTDGSILFYEKF